MSKSATVPLESVQLIAKLRETQLTTNEKATREEDEDTESGEDDALAYEDNTSDDPDEEIEESDLEDSPERAAKSRQIKEEDDLEEADQLRKEMAKLTLALGNAESSLTIEKSISRAEKIGKEEQRKVFEVQKMQYEEEKKAIGLEWKKRYDEMTRSRDYLKRCFDAKIAEVNSLKQSQAADIEKALQKQAAEVEALKKERRELLVAVQDQGRQAEETQRLRKLTASLQEQVESLQQQMANASRTYDVAVEKQMSMAQCMIAAEERWQEERREWEAEKQCGETRPTATITTDYSAFTVELLKKQCRDRNIEGFKSFKKKAEYVAALHDADMIMQQK